MDRSPLRRPTISDVAEAAGVSRAAVSKVLRDAYGVSPAMRERVGAAIDELGYRPRESARAMRTSTHTVGVALPMLRGQFFADVLDGIYDALDATPYRMLVAPFDHETEERNPGMEALWDRSVDAMIVVSPTVAASWLEEFARRVPTVVVARHDAAVAYDSVVDDDRTGAALMVEHLAGLGHRRITHVSHVITEPPRSLAQSPHSVREDGYREAMRRLGLAEHIHVVHTRGSEQGTCDATARLLDEGHAPTALFVGSDQGAFGSLRALAERGLGVPADVSVAGYDDTQFASHPRFSLTTIAQHGAEMGRNAALLALERVEGRDAARRWVSHPRLVVRDSTGAPPAGS
ncbi:LacI family DNA-binding transcriptional regulator [Streptomyces sp. NPDC049879]|uniref:LacI family DNA-binding transcriptional regulator n=1 Tax=Streptomyces sp. NPDC049879 TaxID=3365598 RepID=UPI00379951BB